MGQGDEELGIWGKAMRSCGEEMGRETGAMNWDEELGNQGDGGRR